MAESIGERSAKTTGPSKREHAHASRTRLRRHAERAVPERTEEILRAGKVAHVAFAMDGQPYVLPFTYDYADGKLYIHGAYASRTLRALRAGTPVCVEVTLLDGLVASRDALNHSMNYRSAIVFGVAEDIKDLDEKRAAFERMTLRYFPGRTAGSDYAPASLKDLKSTELLAIALDEMGAKTRSGPPLGPRDADPDAPGSAYVVPLSELDV